MRAGSRSGWGMALSCALLLTACAAPSSTWRAHERGLPPGAGDGAALWQRLTADATANERHGDLAGLHPRTLEPSFGVQPIVHLRVADGWLVGVDHGEWSGVLWWVAADGAAHERITTANVVALVDAGGEVVAVTGLAHLGSSDGALLHLERADRWRVVRSTSLPGAPATVAIVPPLGLVLTFVHSADVRVWCGGALSAPFHDIASQRVQPR